MARLARSFVMLPVFLVATIALCNGCGAKSTDKESAAAPTASEQSSNGKMRADKPSDFTPFDASGLAPIETPPIFYPAVSDQDPKGGGDSALQTARAEPAPIGSQVLTITPLAQQLEHPWSIAFLPNGDMLVTERVGRIRLIKDGTLIEEPIRGGPPTLNERQGGYFDILAHPDFAQNKTVFLSYAAGTTQHNFTKVISATFDGTALSNLRTVFEARPLKTEGLHFGGRLAIDGSGKLLITIGDGFLWRRDVQDPSTAFGKTFRLNLDGTIPDDNPDFGDEALPGLFTAGHRNAQGLAYDSTTGTIWLHEHGAKGGDEVNRLVGGANYGWPLASHGIHYSGDRYTPFTEYEGTTQPIKYWTPSIAPSGLAVYRGDLFRSWEGDLLIGALRGTALHRVMMDNGQPVGEERYLTDEGWRIRDIRIGPDGAIYIATDDPIDGAIYRLVPAPAQ